MQWLSTFKARRPTKNKHKYLAAHPNLFELFSASFMQFMELKWTFLSFPDAYIAN